MTTNSTGLDQTPHLPSNKPKSKSIRWLWLVALAIVVAAIVMTQAGRTKASSESKTEGGGGKKSKKGGAGGPIPVAVAKARRGDVPVYLNGLGNVSAFYTVTVRTRVDGQLMNVAFKEGDFVKEGQLLAQIDPRPFQVQLDQAEGQMAKDLANLRNSRLDLERYRTLLQQDAIPKQQLDTQISTVSQNEGAIKQDQAAIDNAKLNLTYARITAPISGRIGLRLVDPGNIVHASDANGLLVITQLQPIATLFTLPEDNLPQVLQKLRAGIHLPVEAWNRDNSKKLAAGHLQTVDNTIDPTTGTSKLKAVFENKDSALFPNQFVNIRLLVETQHRQILVPTAAIQRGQQGTFLYVVTEDGTAQLRPVQMGITEGNDTSIRSGVEEGEVVVTDGTDKLQTGAKVRVRPNNPGQKGPATEDGTEGAGGGPVS